MLVTKTVGPIVLAIIMIVWARIVTLLASNMRDITSLGREQATRVVSVRLIALSYVVLTPAMNAAIMTLSCEV